MKNQLYGDSIQIQFLNVTNVDKCQSSTNDMCRPRFGMMSAKSKIKVNYSLTIFDLHAILHFTRKSRVHILHSITTSCTIVF